MTSTTTFRTAEHTFEMRRDLYEIYVDMFPEYGLGDKHWFIDGIEVDEAEFKVAYEAACQ